MNQNNQTVDFYPNEYSYQPNDPSYYYASHPPQLNAQNKPVYQVPYIPQNQQTFQPFEKQESEDIASSDEEEDEEVPSSSGHKNVPVVLDEQAKKEKNRQSARDCRNKKKIYIETMEGRIIKMETQIRSCYHRNKWYAQLVDAMVKKDPELQLLLNEYNKKWTEDETKRANEFTLTDVKKKTKGSKKAYALRM
ncbi:hypothetical protein M3Y97_01078200 [Aphelenchoides bicaudatus]|nr:hypothetical protein M3Y97_01078200 [Aphelenchoides bicaudatus]